MQAYDDLYPGGTSTATVDVTMQRNENRPRWQHETPIRVTIKETEPMGFVVTDKPRAVDQDGVSCVYMYLFEFHCSAFAEVSPDRKLKASLCFSGSEEKEIYANNQDCAFI